jgi:hypothetical protein
VNGWEYLDRAGERMAQRESRIIPSDFRGWLALGLFVQSSSLFALMWLGRDLLQSQGFMTLASAVIVTGWVGGAVAFAYSAGKQQGEATALAKQAMNLAANNAGDTPQKVTVTNTAEEPVPTTDTPAAAAPPGSAP